MTKFGSVSSGIEAASVAWGPLGWSAAWFSEIAPFPCAVLATHYPTVPNYGDMRALPVLIRAGAADAPDILCGGTPCQAFSVAGNRGSLDDARGNLTLTFCEIADAIDDKRGDEPAAIILWENVPGVLSTKDNAFGCFLGRLAGEDAPLEPAGPRWSDAGCVFGPRRTVAWRILDAQFFGLAQRRRRVFVVASARDDFDPAEVLLEFEGVRRDLAPSRGAGEDAAGGAARGADRSGGDEVADTLRSHPWPGSYSVGAIAPVRGVTEFLPQSNRVYLPDGVAPALQSTSATRNGDHVPFVLAFGGNDTRGPIPVATACNAKGGAGRSDFESETFVVSPAHAFDARQSDVIQYGDMAGPLDTCGSTIGVLTPRSPATFLHCNKGRPAGRRSAHTEMVTVEVEVVPTITTDGHLQSALVSASAVRRLTPVECERLQGFPDGYTAITYRGKPAADGPRYAAIGNSWATSVVRWIGQRIKAQLQ